MLEILVYPDERLKQVGRPVENFDAALHAFVTELEHTMRASPACVGLAATQVGHLQRIAIVDVSIKPAIPSHGRILLINPEITARDGVVVGREGCMSVPDYTGNVIRAERISLTTCDLKGEKLQYQLEGFEARAVQHEIDHLDGMLFLDRLVSRRDDLFQRKTYK